MADVAVEYGAARFVLVSTDKAANPKNLLGQSKAVCEWIVEAYGNRDDVSTRFVAVRFGNVLNSSGSVIPIFRRQIEKGGPVTVTHPEMTRYFMTIPEAVSLVVQAGAIGGRGQVYVLDMGEPVKIIDLARNMIRLSGKEPGKDIAVEFVGAKPGEKLNEVLWNEDETVGPTSHAKILRAARAPIHPGWLDDELGELEHMVGRGETLDVVSKLATLMREPRRIGSAVLEDTLH
jgi:FlaA1/EpsC-like NDP-sugar epimerase